MVGCGTPIVGDPVSFAGKNVWGAAPAYAEHEASFGGKVNTMISVGGVLYGYGALWTSQNASDPVHRSGAGPRHTLVWSSDLGNSWQVAPWSNEVLGSFLNFGQDNAGALAFYRSNGFAVDGTEKTVELGGTELVEIRLRKGFGG